MTLAGSSVIFPRKEIRYLHGGDAVDDRADGGEHPKPGAAALRVSARQRRQFGEGEYRPDRNRTEHRAAQRVSVLDHSKRKARSDVDERRGAREQSGDRHTTRNRDLETRNLVVEEDPGGSDGVNGQEATGHEEREGEQKDAGITAPIGGLPSDIGKDARTSADGQEQHEVQTGVAPLGIKMSPQKQRHKADERKDRRADPRRAHRDARNASSSPHRALLLDHGLAGDGDRAQ